MPTRLRPIDSVSVRSDGWPTPWPTSKVRVLCNIAGARWMTHSNQYPVDITCLWLHDLDLARHLTRAQHFLRGFGNPRGAPGRPPVFDAPLFRRFLRCRASEYHIATPARPSPAAPAVVTLTWADGTALELTALDPRHPILVADVPRRTAYAAFPRVITQSLATGRTPTSLRAPHPPLATRRLLRALAAADAT